MSLYDTFCTRSQKGYALADPGAKIATGLLASLLHFLDTGTDVRLDWWREAEFRTT